MHCELLPLTPLVATGNAGKYLSKMVALRIRNNNWQEDLLKEALNEFVRQGLRRDEILDYMVRDFPDYAWSIRTLDRRLRYFGIFYTDVDVTVEQVEQVVRSRKHAWILSYAKKD